MSVKKTLPVDDNNIEAVKKPERKSPSLRKDHAASKRGRFDNCFSFNEITMPTGSSLAEMDSNELKAKIKRWAKAVVAYARQVSGKFGSSRTSTEGSRREDDYKPG